MTGGGKKETGENNIKTAADTAAEWRWGGGKKNKMKEGGAIVIFNNLCLVELTSPGMLFSACTSPGTTRTHTHTPYAQSRQGICVLVCCANGKREEIMLGTVEIPNIHPTTHASSSHSHRCFEAFMNIFTCVFRVCVCVWGCLCVLDELYLLLHMYPPLSHPWSSDIGCNKEKQSVKH